MWDCDTDRLIDQDPDLTPTALVEAVACAPPLDAEQARRIRRFLKGKEPPGPPDEVPFTLIVPVPLWVTLDGEPVGSGRLVVERPLASGWHVLQVGLPDAPRARDAVLFRAVAGEPETWTAIATLGVLDLVSCGASGWDEADDALAALSDADRAWWGEAAAGGCTHGRDPFARAVQDARRGARLPMPTFAEEGRAAALSVDPAAWDRLERRGLEGAQWANIGVLAAGALVVGSVARIEDDEERRVATHVATGILLGTAAAQRASLISAAEPVRGTYLAAGALLLAGSFALDSASDPPRYMPSPLLVGSLAAGLLQVTVNEVGIVRLRERRRARRGR